MTFYGSRNDLEVKLNTVAVTISSNPLARCMYYLNCVMQVVEINDSEIRRYTDFQKYYNLNEREKDLVLRLCEEFDPATLMRIGIFCKVDSLPRNFSNEFIKITHTNTTLIANQTLSIGGHQVRAKQIMFCKQSWLNQYYYEAIRGLRNQQSSSCTII